MICYLLPQAGRTLKNMRASNQQELSQFICEFRRSTGLTQEQFAAFLGVTYPTINRWENGRTNPSPIAMKLIEQKLLEMGECGSNLRKRYLVK
jgi:DNA-binding transcriptional regulator YiaG